MINTIGASMLNFVMKDDGVKDIIRRHKLKNWENELGYEKCILRHKDLKHQFPEDKLEHI